MTELTTGEHVRRALRTMSWGDRRIVLVALHERVGPEKPSDPLGSIFEALLHDIGAAEVEEMALRDLLE